MPGTARAGKLLNRFGDNCGEKLRIGSLAFLARSFLQATKNISPPKRSITNPHQRFTLMKSDLS